MSSRPVIMRISPSASRCASAGVDAGTMGRAAFWESPAFMRMLPALSRLVGLLHDQRTIDLVADADAAGFGERARILVRHHRTPDTGAFRVPERAFALHAGSHLRKHRVQEYRLELVGLGFGFGLFLWGVFVLWVG